MGWHTLAQGVPQKRNREGVADSRDEGYSYENLRHAVLVITPWHRIEFAGRANRGFSKKHEENQI